MKTIFSIVLLMICFTSVSYAQKTYSYENLEKMSQLEMNEQLVEALKQQKKGKVLTNTGLILISSGAAVVIGAAASGNVDEVTLAISGAFALVGLPFLAVGLPVKNKAKNKIKTINTINARRGIGSSLSFNPSIQYIDMDREYHPGVTISFTF